MNILVGNDLGNKKVNELQNQMVVATMQNQFAVTVSDVKIDDGSITASVEGTPINIYISTNRYGLIQEHGAAAKLTDDLYLGWNFH